MDTNQTNAHTITCFGVNLSINNDNELRSFIGSVTPNPKWKTDLESYYSVPLINFDYHKKNCSKLSSLKNRVFADYEWELLKDNWDTIKTSLNIDSPQNLDDIKNIYQGVTEVLFPLFDEKWKKVKAEKKKDNTSENERSYPRPFAEINRLFVGFNKDLCPIIDDNSIKALIEELRDAGYVELDDDDKILKVSQEDGGWLIRSKMVSELFNKFMGDKNEYQIKTIPWICLQKLKDKRLQSLLENNRNVILTGAPGTGKTFSAQQIAKEFAGDRVKTVQFHPSYDYTDFVEGMRPNNNGTFTRTDGVFKRFCKCAIWGLGVDVDDNELADKERNYKETSEPSNDPYVFIIDEINRGEISKIFGELFFCIESSHRGEKERMDTQYQNLVPEDDLFSKGFYVPDNVYIIGTMNDIDRSVESMDFAFRRRFAFYEVPADSDMLNTLADYDSKTIEEIKQHMERLNKELIKDEYGLSSAYQIGGAYFLNFKKYYSGQEYKERKVLNAFNSLWNNHLRGTIYEYFRGMPQKELIVKMEKLKAAYDGK